MASVNYFFRQLIAWCASFLSELSGGTKRSVAFLVDASSCVLATFFALLFLNGQHAKFDEPGWVLSGLSIAFVFPIFNAFGLYKNIIRFSGSRSFSSVGAALALYALVFFVTTLWIDFPEIPERLVLLQSILLSFLVFGSRFSAAILLTCGDQKSEPRPEDSRVLIYGAGSAGLQASNALRRGSRYKIVGFLDDDTSKHGRVIDGNSIYPPDSLGELVSQYKVTHIFLALPSISREKRNVIFRLISKHHLVVRVIPPLINLVNSNISLFDMQDPDVDDLLGREIVVPDPILVSRKISGQSILISGAGGSIGSELCKQLLLARPKTMVLIEQSEFALYSIHSQLTAHADGEIQIVPLLCSVTDNDRLEQIFNVWRPRIIYHAAAYKHVPIVEQNIVEGVKNNVIGMMTLAQAAIKSGVSDFILISSDKAVRPTNTMGATKRLCEMIAQSLDDEHKDICFSMVRFGNVLESSGSVIPKFKSQIANGGPVTVTHPDVTRFFMTVTEAAQLVTQASAMATGGEVFVLDMGAPVKILDLAHTLIRLSGLTVKTELTPFGDVEVEFTGLRSGEKLYEELLIGENSEPTQHPKIMKARETKIRWPDLMPHIKYIEQAVSDGDVAKCLTALALLVEGFDVATESNDLIQKYANQKPI